MTWRQALAVAALLMVTTGLVCALGVFQARAQALAAEGRALLSPEAVAVHATVGELMEHRAEFAVGTRAFRDLEEVPRARTVVVLNGNWSDVAPSIGIRFSASDVGRALVGEAVHTEVEGGVPFVEVAGAQYEVVGRLGLREDSLLAEDILIAAPALFDAAQTRTVLDGPDIGTRAVAVFGRDRIEPVAGGANRRTTVDFVTPIVLTLGFAVATMASAVAAVSAARHEGDRARIRRLVGLGSAAVLFRTVVVACGTPMIVCAAVLTGLSCFGVRLAWPALGAVSSQCMVFVVVMLLVGPMRRRSWS